jgi:mRNA-degrading endonuclease toxin of MazEF toxin-antitoxin module
MLRQNEIAMTELSPKRIAETASGVPAPIVSPGLDAATVSAVAVVPTFRRPAMLAETLASLSAQKTDVRFAVLVVENDAAGREGLGVAASWLATGSLQGMALVEQNQGNVHAINAGFAAALAQFPNAGHLLMIDDDEVASAGWIDAMVAAAKATGADIVGGPVVPRFRDDAPRMLRQHPVFWPSHVTTGPVPMIYGTGNCLITRRTFETLGMPALDTRFNFLGGGDLDFFTRAKRAGLRSHWVQEALITETVPGDRARIGWVLRRGLRIGSINRAVETRQATDAAGRLKVILKDLAIVPLACVRAATQLLATGNPVVAAHPLAVSLGRLMAAAGIEQQPYRATSPVEAKGSQ